MCCYVLQPLPLNMPLILYTLDPYSKMIAPAEKKPTIKIAGYLEKRGKMRVVCRWKRWWFVLEGRLLLYYKSQLEYINLSPCRGSLNLGLASSVLPGKGLELQVITRSQTVTLRAGNRIDHEQWLQSLVDAMALQGSINPFCLRPVLHFRYYDEIPLVNQRGTVVERIKHLGGRSYTLTKPKENWPSSDTKGVEETASLISDSKTSNIVQSNLKKHVLRRHMSFSNDRLKDNKQFDRKSIRHSIRHSKIAFSDTSIPVSVHNQLSPSVSNEKCQSMKELQDSFCTSNVENHEYVEIDVSPKNNPFILVDNETNSENKSGSREIKHSNSEKVKLNSDSQVCNKDDLKDDDIEIVQIFLNGCPNTESENRSVNRNNLKSNLGIVEYKDKNKLCVQIYQNKQVKSDTDLSMKNKSRTHSGSCGEIHCLNNRVNSKVEPVVTPQFLSSEKNVSNVINGDSIMRNSSCRTSSKPRSNSVAKKSKDCKPETDTGTLQRRGTLRKRSLSFLRRVWKKREKKNEEQDYETVDYESIPVCIEVQKPIPDQIEPKKEEPLKEMQLLAPEPPPDYDLSLSDDSELPPVLPPRLKKRPHSPWHDIPTNNMPVLPPVDEPPPALPEKTRNKNSSRISEDGNVHCIKHQEISYNHDSISYQSETRLRVNKINKTDLDSLIAELTEVNISPIINENRSHEENQCNTLSISINNDSEPDYDIPRPHTSLLMTLRSHASRRDTIPATNFFCSTPILEKDSLDSMLSRFSSELDIAPDSLEFEIPWSLSGQAEVNDITWPRPALLNEPNSLQRHFITTEEKTFEDSLNS